ncbi:MAG: domain S-box protein [Clostridiales bacterium]|jgi:DUF438 domain-containing protein|nr:domain S-box protein [Clostridiales bacterium]
MSEIINNREYRQKVLKELIGELHGGKSVDEVKARFAKLIEGISPSEISEMEQALIMEGMPIEEIQRLCDVHAAVFKGSIEEIHRPEKEEDVPGHPVHTFKFENRKLESLINQRIKPHIESFRNEDSQDNLSLLKEDFNTLWEVDKHYSRKENLLFPYMERYEITAPPKVMWGKDDEIRDAIKEIKKLLSSYGGNKDELAKKADEAANGVIEMIFKEENILFPMVLDILSEDEWLKIAEESGEIGYTLIEPKGKWKPIRVNVEEKVKEQGEKPSNNGYVKFDAGILLPEEINAMLNTLPIDITFVDKDGSVKYFSQGKERIFPRPKTIIGRQVQNCHPPASVHIVEEIVEDLKSGRKDHEDFWIKMGSKYVYIRYFAVRNEKGEYLGTMEVSQDIKPIQDISGEKRLLSNG